MAQSNAQPAKQVIIWMILTNFVTLIVSFHVMNAKSNSLPNVHHVMLDILYNLRLVLLLLPAILISLVLLAPNNMP